MDVEGDRWPLDTFGVMKSGAREEFLEASYPSTSWIYFRDWRTKTGMSEGTLSSETECPLGASPAGLSQVYNCYVGQSKTRFICVLRELNATSEKMFQL